MFGKHLLVFRKHGNTCLFRARRYLSSNSSVKYPIAVIGSGPSGFYTTKYLLDQNDQIHVDIFEKLPFPYGLVRYGVAPDHPEVKTVTNSFEEIFHSDKNRNRIRFFGNVEIGDFKSNTLALESLLKSYSAVVLAYGAHSDHSLRLKYEDSYSGILSSREFVNWYNGHPDYQNLHHSKHFMDSKTQSLRNIRNIIIIGNGNVAIDIARICLKDIEELRQTDITPEAADFIQKIQNTLEAVYIVGRRGHIQSSFTIKELRELSRLTNKQQPIPTFFQPDELKEGMTLSSGKEIENNRPKKRIIDLMETINKQNPYTGSTRSPRIEMRFLLSPTELKSSDGNAKDSHISSVVFNRNRLVGDPFHQRAVAMENETIELPCDLLIKSIGYKSVAVDSLIPFNPKTNTVENKNGKVLMPVSTQKFAHQLFVTGWLKRGPSGIIGTNISDAKETMSQVIDTIQSNNLPSYPLEYDPIHTLKNESNSNQKILDGVISWSEVQRINQVELERGEKCTPNKIRWKITNAQEMVKIAKSTSE